MFTQTDESWHVALLKQRNPQIIFKITQSDQGTFFPEIGSVSHCENVGESLERHGLTHGQ